ncbi:MAG: hypothetical protein HZB42_00915 [Sphingobacteriales bacterium]|nr:hypothetical protein [Sphingobacteriales bacterium]
MKKILLFSLLIFSIGLHSQKAVQKGRKPALLANDTVVVRLQKTLDSSVHVQQQFDSADINTEFRNSFDSIIQLQKEQKARQKKAAMVRIGIGVALLIVLFIGLMRRRKGK